MRMLWLLLMLVLLLLLEHLGIHPAGSSSTSGVQLLKLLLLRELGIVVGLGWGGVLELAGLEGGEEGGGERLHARTLHRGAGGGSWGLGGVGLGGMGRLGGSCGALVLGGSGEVAPEGGGLACAGKARGAAARLCVKGETACSALSCWEGRDALDTTSHPAIT